MAPPIKSDKFKYRINFNEYLVPNINLRKYRYAHFDDPLVLRVNGTQIKEIPVKSTIGWAWKSVEDLANGKPISNPKASRRVAGLKISESCNDYFTTLSRRMTLKQVLDEGGITFHCLMPKEGYLFNDLPAANTAGHDIGIHPELLLNDNNDQLVCTLIHELAHVAGASTSADEDDPHALDAENALPPCGCGSKDFYNPKNYGLLQIQRRSRIA